ncbi:DUF4124 domain-containing protein [Marinobacter daepoensis]|uniref:DUF4124 domain-containing protein n=1 Tax=Marinobacter daepoensis TaxID=262077 RepID=UPI0004A26933
MFLRRSFICLLYLLSTAPLTAQAQAMYKWVDENGVTHYSDSRSDERAKRVIPPGMTIVPMGSNVGAQRAIERLGQGERRSSSSSSRARANAQKKQDQKRKAAVCKRYKDRIEWIDNRLRAGGYSNSQGNRWRAERREVSSKRAWECLRK